MNAVSTYPGISCFANELDLSEETDVEQTIEKVRSLSPLEKLSLPGCVSGPDLARILPLCSELRVLDLTRCTQLTDDDKFNALTRYCPKLKEVIPGVNGWKRLPVEIIFHIYSFLSFAIDRKRREAYEKKRTEAHVKLYCHRDWHDMRHFAVNHPLPSYLPELHENEMAIHKLPVVSRFLHECLHLQRIVRFINNKPYCFRSCPFEKIQKISQELKELKGISYLDLSHSSLETTKKIVGFFSDLKRMGMPKFNSEETDDFFSGSPTLGKLEMLEMVFNDLSKQMPASLSNLSSLQTLSLKFNCNLKAMPHTLSQLTSLAELELEENPIEFLPNVPTSLRVLKLQSDELLTLPDLSGCNSLEVLHLKLSGKITCIPDTVSTLTSLTELRISRMNLTARVDISGMTALRKLNIEDCPNITVIPDFKKKT